MRESQAVCLLCGVPQPPLSLQHHPSEAAASDGDAANSRAQSLSIMQQQSRCSGCQHVLLQPSSCPRPWQYHGLNDSANERLQTWTKQQDLPAHRESAAAGSDHGTGERRYMVSGPSSCNACASSSCNACASSSRSHTKSCLAFHDLICVPLLHLQAGKT